MNHRLIATIIAFAAAGAAQAQIAFIDTPQRLDYVTSDIGEQLFLNIDVDLDGSEDFSFTILNSDGERFLGGLDFTRNNGFVGDFDADDNFIFRTFAEGDAIGPDLEFDLGLETFTYADYALDLNGSTPLFGGGLASSSVIVGFGIASSEVDTNGEEQFGFLYGWMRVTFGELVATSTTAPSNTFIEVSQIAYSTSLNAAVAAGVIPTPGTAALLATGGLLVARRRR